MISDNHLPNCMLKIIFTLLFLFPFILFAQDVSNLIPKKDIVKDTSGQKDLVDIAKSLFKIKPARKRKLEDKRVYFSFLPISGNVPGGAGHALITSTTAAIYLGPRRTTNISSLTFTPYFNFKGRFGLPLRTSIWTPDNSWTIQGDTRLLIYPQYTWGLGTSHHYDNRTLVDYRYMRLYQSALKRITPYLYAGGGYNLDYYSNVKSIDTAVNLKTFTNYPYGTDGRSFSSGLTINLLYDTRNNSINPLPGAYANVVYRFNPRFLGSNSNWQSLYLDARKYVSLNRITTNKQNSLAFWGYYWTSLRSNAPYLNLPSIGWDPGNRSGRGIDQNRYRGTRLLYLESEYRRDITENGLLGFVVFANINTVSGSGSMFTTWNPAVGTGLRIKFNKGSNTNVCIDYGVSKGYSAIMLNLGEAF